MLECRSPYSGCKALKPTPTKVWSIRPLTATAESPAATLTALTQNRVGLHEESTMNLKQTARAMSFGAILGLACLSAPVFAADGDAMQSFTTEMNKMANKDGMVTKKDFMAMMEKRWNAMDKSKKGMLSKDEVMKIFSADNKGA